MTFENIVGLFLGATACIYGFIRLSWPVAFRRAAFGAAQDSLRSEVLAGTFWCAAGVVVGVNNLGFHVGWYALAALFILAVATLWSRAGDKKKP